MQPWLSVGGSQPHAGGTGAGCGVMVTCLAPWYPELQGVVGFPRGGKMQEMQTWKAAAPLLCREAAKAEMFGDGAAGADPSGAGRGEGEGEKANQGKRREEGREGKEGGKKERKDGPRAALDVACLPPRAWFYPAALSSTLGFSRPREPTKRNEGLPLLFPVGFCVTFLFVSQNKQSYQPTPPFPRKSARNSRRSSFRGSVVGVTAAPVCVVPAGSPVPVCFGRTEEGSEQAPPGAAGGLGFLLPLPHAQAFRGSAQALGTGPASCC